MTAPIRVGIVGVGWGSVVQTPAFRMVPEYEVVALCSRRPESVAAAGEKLEIADTSTDWESFVRRDDLDLISICTPVDLHHEQTLAALDAGKHVLVEKPVAVNLRQAREMLDAAEASGRAHAVCYENRFGTDRLPVMKMVRDGFLGQPYFCNAVNTADYWHPSRGLQSEWMYKVDEGGGYLMGMASHDIDFTCALFGPPVEVAADIRTSVPRRERPDGSVIEVDADDTSVLLMRMASGALVSIATSVVGVHSQGRHFIATGSDGTIEMGGGVMGGVEIRAGGVADEGLAPVAADERMPRSGMELPKRRAAGAIRSLAVMLEEWLPALDGQPAPGVPTLRDGWVTQQVIEAARRSAAGEGWVSLSA